MIARSTPRRLRLPFAGLAAVLAVALLPAGAAGATTQVGMTPAAFNPAAKTISRGDAVRWKNNSPIQHDVKSKLGGYFASKGGSGGMGPGAVYTFTFPSAGSFGYLCRFHKSYPMQGTITVPITVTKLTGPVRFKVVVASKAVTGKWRHVVQVKKPGATSWSTLATTKAKQVVLKPNKRGTYVFRSAVKNNNTGKLSGYSPTVSRTH